jgi:hypothetical protein
MSAEADQRQAERSTSATRSDLCIYYGKDIERKEYPPHILLIVIYRETNFKLARHGLSLLSLLLLFISA